MLRLAPQVAARLSPEVEEVVQRFLGAWPASAVNALASIRLFGAQARGFDPSSGFSLLVLFRERSMAGRVALSVASDVAARDGLYRLDVTAATQAEWSEPPSSALARTFANARREGVVLWERPEA